ncbi:hypothetical protein CRG98_006540 [Punica granatum]|uniref:Uncharacterized protein n=1 Tax=Punica granatum TaxID=22663 RepID=A0A2I0KX36_PUNGR|nr:hypothetical protein CRG98_006540 [Punica granatum]
MELTFAAYGLGHALLLELSLPAFAVEGLDSPFKDIAIIRCMPRSVHMKLASEALILGRRIKIQSKGPRSNLPSREELAINLRLGNRPRRRTRPGLPFAALLGLQGWGPLRRLRRSRSRGSIWLGSSRDVQLQG